MKFGVRVLGTDLGPRTQRLILCKNRSGGFVPYGKIFTKTSKFSRFLATEA